MFNGIMGLKNKGYYPDTVLDIGAYKGVWSQNCYEIYDKSKYILFEAIEYPELISLNNNNNIITNILLLYETVTELDWYQKKNTGDSIFKELTFHFNDCEIIKRKTITLDNYFNTNNYLCNSKNILIKIDCQGAEIPILKGALTILKNVDFIILELPFFGKYNDNVPNFLGHIQFMDSIGFIPFDIFEFHIINGFNMQLDMIFINKNHEFNNLVQKLNL